MSLENWSRLASRMHEQAQRRRFEADKLLEDGMAMDFKDLTVALNELRVVFDRERLALPRLVFDDWEAYAAVRSLVGVDSPYDDIRIGGFECSLGSRSEHRQGAVDRFVDEEIG